MCHLMGSRAIIVAVIALALFRLVEAAVVTPLTTTVWLFRFEGEGVSYQTLFPIYLAFAIHAWYLAKKNAKRPAVTLFFKKCGEI
jgi:hypothetical protein